MNAPRSYYLAWTVLALTACVVLLGLWAKSYGNTVGYDIAELQDHILTAWLVIWIVAFFLSVGGMRAAPSARKLPSGRSVWTSKALYWGALGTLLLSAMIGTPSILERHVASRRTVCLRVNVRELDDAKEECAYRMDLRTGEVVTINILLPFLKERRPPICPNAGRYIPGRIGEPARCSVHGTQND